jgi:altronate dehydratase
MNLIVKIANGKETKNEENEYREISIFKDVVML